jgi:WhiB family redox-sensing transcriptional regulator
MLPELSLTPVNANLTTGPVEAPPRWAETGTCAEVDPELFFPLDEDGPGSIPARRLCAGCPVLQQCQEYALASGMSAGIWGGLSTAERDKLVRARQRAARSSGGAR